MLVSIIIPVYQVEKFIERCAVSLFKQDFKYIEYIFIDDNSSDNSIFVLEQVLQRYPIRAISTRIIRNKNNIGIFEVRKLGVMMARGEYILHIDSDDWCKKNMVSMLYSAAKINNSDIVFCDYYSVRKKILRYNKQSYPEYSKKGDFKSTFLHKVTMNVWNKLIKREIHIKLYEDINLSKHINMGENWLIIYPLFYSAKQITYVPHALYYYNRANNNSLTSIFKAKGYTDGFFVFQFLYHFLKPKLSQSQFKILREKLFLALCSLTSYAGVKINKSFLNLLSINFLDLWGNRQISFSNKIMYSFYFLQMPWIPKIIRKTFIIYLKRL